MRLRQSYGITFYFDFSFGQRSASGNSGAQAERRWERSRSATPPQSRRRKPAAVAGNTIAARDERAVLWKGTGVVERDIRPNPPVDRFVAHHLLPLTLSPPDDLLRAESLPDHGLNGRKLRRPIPQVPAGSPLPSARLLHRVARPIAAIMRRLIPLHLPIQRATMT
jgi:hypothetical protein